MTEHLSSTTEHERSPSALHPAELTAMYVTIHNMLDRGTSAEDVRSVASSLLEKAGYPPLAEHESQRTISVDIDGVEQEQTIAVDLDDFGVLIQSPEEMNIEGFSDVRASAESEPSIAHVEHALGQTALAEAINEGIPSLSERLGDAPVDMAEVDDAETEQVSEAEDEPDRSSERAQAHNVELMDGVRKALSELKDLDESSTIAVRRAADEIAELATRPMIDTDELGAMTRSIHTRVTALVEQGSSLGRKLTAVGEELDTGASDAAQDNRNIEDAYATIRRASAGLEDEVMTELRIVDRIAQELRYDPSARQQLVARTRHLTDMVNEATKRHGRMLEDIQL